MTVITRRNRITNGMLNNIEISQLFCKVSSFFRESLFDCLVYVKSVSEEENIWTGKTFPPLKLYAVLSLPESMFVAVGLRASWRGCPDISELWWRAQGVVSKSHCGPITSCFCDPAGRESKFPGGFAAHLLYGQSPPLCCWAVLDLSPSLASASP